MRSGDGDYSDAPSAVLGASWGMTLAVLAGAFVSAYATCWVFLVPSRQYYDLPGELGTFFALLCATATFSLCWGTLCAYVIRKLRWSPRTCSFCALPFALVCVATFLFHSSHRDYANLAFLGFAAGAFATVVCWKSAYPTIDRKALYRNWRGGPTLFQR
jgi:hypothetical protein